jgi:hypothetical protein
MRETLAEICDFNRLNDPTQMRIACWCRQKVRRERLFAMLSAAGMERHPGCPALAGSGVSHVKINDHWRLPASHDDRLANLVWRRRPE